MLIVISGPTCVGKSYCVEFLCSRYGFKTVVPYTTRKPRVSESEGFHYHFRSEKELRELTANFRHGYWATPLDENWYGYTEHVDELFNSPGNWIMQAYSDIALEIKKRNPTGFTIFLDFRSENIFEKRLRERFGEDNDDLDRRRRHAEHERSCKNKFDHIIELDNPESIADELAKFTFTKVTQSPNTPLLYAGPLSDTDIISSIVNDPYGIRIEGIDQKELEWRINGWSLDLTLSSKYFRVTRRKWYKRVFDLAYSGEQDIKERFEEVYADLEKGIYLRPQEFILGSTHEKLTLTKNKVAIVTGRSSYARIGISVELSQIILQPGHDDTIPLQIKNNLPYPVIIYPSTPIAQVVFFKTISDATASYERQSDAKYLGRLADFRSRFYRDGIYKEIRNQRNPRKRIDWDLTLNVLLFMLIWALAASWLISEFTNGPTSISAKSVQIVVFILTTLVGIIRGYRFFHSRNSK